MNTVDVRAHLVGRKFPDILDDADYDEVISAALRDLNRFGPVDKLAIFTTVAGTQDYLIFDPENAVTEGLCAGALEIKDVMWSPGGDWSTLDILLPDEIVFTGGYFHNPSQMMVLRQKLDAFKAQFGSQGWDVYGLMGDASAYLKLSPVPRGECKVVIDFTTAMTLEDIPATGRIVDAFWQWTEYYAADALANLYATTAGVDLLNFADSKSAMTYWEGKAGRYYNKAVTLQGGPGGCAMRS